MGRIFIFLLLLCVNLVGTPAYVHAHEVCNTHSVSAVKDLHRVLTLQGTPAQYQVKTPIDKEENLYLVTADNEDEDDLLRKYSLLTRYVVAFLSTCLFHNSDSGLAHPFPFYQHHADADAPLYVRLRVFRI